MEGNLLTWSWYKISKKKNELLQHKQNKYSHFKKKMTKIPHGEYQLHQFYSWYLDHVMKFVGLERPQAI